MVVREARAKFQEPRPFLSEFRPFRSDVLSETTSPIDLFSATLQLTHAKVSHSSSFHRSIARAGGSIS